MHIDVYRKEHTMQITKEDLLRKLEEATENQINLLYHFIRAMKKRTAEREAK